MIVKSYVEAQDKRGQLDIVFISLYSALIGLYNFLNQTPIPHTSALLSIFCVGIGVGFTWIGLIKKALKTEQRNLVLLYEIESLLPVRAFTTPGDKQNEEGKDKLFRPTYYELALPLFLVLILIINLFTFLINAP